MDNSKKVSIIMGIYNCAPTLESAIESIMAQTYTNWEFIMCDDGSSDNTYEIANSYVEKYPDKFILVKNEKNMGLNYTLNKCLELATGDYIARMDGDDLSLPERFEKEVDFLNNHPEYAIVSGFMIFFDDEGDWGISSNIEKPQVIDFVKHSPFFNHAPCMIRKEAFLDVGGYTVDKRLLRYEDCNLWYKMYGKGYRGYNLQEPIYKMLDDRNALGRRTFSARLRAAYVKYVGFKLVNMPKKYYIYIVISFVKNLFIGLCPSFIYKALHQRKNKGSLEK